MINSSGFREHLGAQHGLRGGAAGWKPTSAILSLTNAGDNDPSKLRLENLHVCIASAPAVCAPKPPGCLHMTCVMRG